MSIELKISSIIFILIIIVLMFELVKRQKITIKYSLVWFFPLVLLLIFTIIPGFLTWVTNILGFQTASNMIITLLLGLLMIISIALTVIVSNQKEQIRNLIQEVSILKKDKKNEKK